MPLMDESVVKKNRLTRLVGHLDKGVRRLRRGREVYGALAPCFRNGHYAIGLIGNGCGFVIALEVDGFNFTRNFAEVEITSQEFCAPGSGFIGFYILTDILSSRSQLI